MRCDFCSRETQVGKVQKYRYTGIGLENVFLDNIEVRFCGECNLDSPIIPKVLKLVNTIGGAIVCKNGLLDGGEMRFLRKNLRVKSQDWAALLRTDKSVYSRWESGAQKISAQSDLLIRYLYLRLLEEKKGVRFEPKIVENLAAAATVENEKTAIVVDVEQIEVFSYMPLAEALRLSENQKTQPSRFDFSLDESNLFLGEIEEPMPFGKINDRPFGKAMAAGAAANQELALAA